LELRVNIYILGFRDYGFRFGVEGLGSKVYGLGCRV
jgi:hypothetical protein